MPEPGNPQAFNRYAYALRNPIKYTDPSGHFVDAVLDVAFIAYGIYDIAAHGYTHEKGVSLLLDVAGLAIPGATGLGMAARVATKADDVAAAVKGVNALGNAVQTANSAENVGEGTRILYHGTNSPAANAIRSNGIDLSVQRANLDFNPGGQKGFYVTNDYEQAVEWAHNRARIRGGEPEVVAFAVPERDLQSLNGKVFWGADPEWASFVTSGRRGTLSHNFDYVEGPMLANPGRGVPAPKGHQLAVFSEDAVRLFNGSMVR